MKGIYSSTDDGRDSIQSLFSPKRILSSLFYKEKVELSRKLICKGSIGAIVGAILGCICSLIVNCTLVEISLSSFFSLYFGLLFLSIGIIILWRISSNKNDESQSRRLQLSFFAVLIILSGLICFVLEKNWFLKLSCLAKIPIYFLLGISIVFALTFSVVDFINFLFGFFQSSVARPVVESKAQVFLILTLTVCMGGIFGIIFGILDVDDEISYHVKLALLKEEPYCYPIGAIFGGLAGFGNEYLRQQEEQISIKYQMDFDEEI